MVDDLLQPLSVIEHLCDELLNQQYGSLAERQIEKTTIIQAQAQSLAQLCENYVSQPASTEEVERHRLWDLCSEFRTPAALIDTSLYFLHLYDAKQFAVLNTQQPKQFQDMQEQIDVLKAVLDKIIVDLQRYIDRDDSG